MEYEIQLRRIEPQDTLVVRETSTMAGIAEVLGGAFSDTFGHAQAQGALPREAFASYSFHDDLVDIEAGCTVSQPTTGQGRILPSILPGGEVATTLHVGPYDQVSEAYAALEAWITEHGRRAAGNGWEVYLSPPTDEPPRTEVVIPLERE
jgi:effector-binding domain-containing protein